MGYKNLKFAFTNRWLLTYEPIWFEYGTIEYPSLNNWHKYSYIILLNFVFGVHHD